MKWLDNMFDNLLNWMENVQWNRDSRRRKRKANKEAKKASRIKKKIDDAKKVLREHGHTFERDWQDIEYKGEKYTPVMIEECSYYDRDAIIITAQKHK